MATTATKKRKSGTTSTAASKKAKLSIDAQADTVDRILSDVTNYEIPDDDAEIRDTTIKLAQYARSLEEEISASKPKEMSPQQLAAAAAKIASAACSGIKKQMSVSPLSYHPFAILKACQWKPSCKTGGAKWVYDGVCQDPKVFGTMMGLDSPATFKMKKFSTTDFENLIGDCTSSARFVLSSFPLWLALTLQSLA